MTAPEGRSAIDAIWRAEAGKVTARLVRMVRDVDLAEEIAQEAFVSALERWPETGVPVNPGAWLMTTAKNRAIDELRRARVARAKEELFGADADEASVFSFEERLDDDVGDDLLRLLFVACHPALAREGQVALTLRLLGGLSTAEIARAFLVAEPTIAQRIVRAKRTLAEKKIPFEVPRRAELAERLTAVLEVVYLIFNEGYAATAGSDWMRPALCEGALRLARVLADLMGAEPDVHALVALMELQSSRTAARTNAAGEPVLLLDQDRGTWDRAAIARGLAALVAAEELVAGSPTPYVVQAQIAACHARAETAADTNWRRIAELYAACGAIAPGPVVEMNRAVAVGFAFGPAAGLVVLEGAAEELAGYHLWWSVRGDLLVKLGRAEEARAALERAASLTQNDRERTLLRERIRGLTRA